MTYKELYESVIDKLEKSKITLGEFEKMIEPLNAEVATDTNVGDKDTISRAKAIDIVMFECGKWTGLAKEISKQIKQLPPARPAHITSKWIPIGMADAVGGESAMWGDKIAYHVCEKCWGQALERDGEEVLSDFCPNCGADMREVTT